MNTNKYNQELIKMVRKNVARLLTAIVKRRLLGEEDG